MVPRPNAAERANERLDAWVVSAIPRAVAYARTLVAQRADAEDVVHDVLCRLLDHEEYDLVADGDKLMFRSITNACINRQTRRRAMLSLNADHENGVAWAALLPSAKADDPVDVAVANELGEAVQRGLALLPPMQRAAL